MTATAHTYFSLGGVKGFSGQVEKGMFEIGRACSCTVCLRGRADKILIAHKTCSLLFCMIGHPIWTHQSEAIQLHEQK